MQELLVKEAILVIPYKSKKYTFIIEQANFSKILEFDFYLKRDNTDIVKHVFTILQKFNKDYTKNMFNTISPEIYNKVHSFIIKNYCTSFYTIKEKLKKKDDIEIETAPFSSVIAFIIKHSNETMESLLKLTWEQIEYLSDWIIYNLNDLTKEWKEENELNQYKKDKKAGKFDDTLTKLRKQRDKVNAKFINNKK